VIVLRATLLVIEGEDHGSRFEIAPPTTTIGRGVHNSIRLNDSEVSRQHAIIEFEAGRFRISDRGSSNGTWVNGQPVHGHPLTDGDRIQIGRTVIVFRPTEALDEATRIGKHVELVVGHKSDQSNIVSVFGQEDLAKSTESRSVHETSGLMANLQTLYRISEEAVNPSCTLDTLLQRILDLTIAVVGADRGCMLLLDNNGKPQPTVFSTSQAQPDSLMPVSMTIVDFVLDKRQAVRTSDARQDGRFTPGQSILRAGVREAICVPMPGHSDLLGAIYIDTTSNPGSSLPELNTKDTFNEDQMKLVLAIGRQAALAIESKQFEQALMKSERLAAMGQTIAMISHHVKNILQGVRGGSYLIEMGLSDDNMDLIRKGWDIVDRNQERIHHLMTDMLSFSKERQPNLLAASIAETVADICESMQARADELNIQFDVEYDATVPVSNFDAEAIHRAILNVVVNAFDAVEGSDNARVLIQTQFDAANNQMMVVVSDNGPGIPDDQLESIFDFFESNKGARGTGLGLAVSRKVMREHGGDILVESRVGQGTRFLLSWPKLDESPDGLERPTTA
jgi:two-component system NtrC family sensor kinase